MNNDLALMLRELANKSQKEVFQDAIREMGAEAFAAWAMDKNGDTVLDIGSKLECHAADVKRYKNRAERILNAHQRAYELARSISDI